MLSCVRLFWDPQTVTHQSPLSMEFSRQEYWHGLPFPPPGDLPGPGIKTGSPVLQAESLSSEPPGKPPEGCRAGPNPSRDLLQPPPQPPVSGSR